MSEQLSTRRLLIRRFTPADLEDFCAYQADPQVRRYLAGEPMDVDQAAQYLASQAVLDERKTKAWHDYAVQLVESGTVIGNVGVYLASEVEGDIGFQFHPGFHRQGYGLEAATAFLAYLFEGLGLERVTAGCDQANDASHALIGRLGLRPQAQPVTAGGYNYELTRDEWSAQRA
jgi:ribosomal-protein-alanine N-acetyltransferase